MKLFAVSLLLALGTVVNAGAYCRNEVIETPSWIVNGIKNGSYHSNLTYSAHFRQRSLRPRQADPQTITIYAHFVGTDVVQNNEAETRLTAQISAINNAFAGSGFSFQLSGAEDAITRTLDSDLAISRTIDTENRMKSGLHKGSYRDLNLYFLSDYNPGTTPTGRVTTGSCPFPKLFPTEDDISIDGCIVKQDVMPGAANPRFDLGITAVHEIGHWLAMEHVWGRVGGTGDPNCEEDDGVSDTTPQLTFTDGCPSPDPVSSCPNADGGLLNIHNYMDYTDDICRTGFTAEQISQMQLGFIVSRIANSLAA